MYFKECQQRNYHFTPLSALRPRQLPNFAYRDEPGLYVHNTIAYVSDNLTMSRFVHHHLPNIARKISLKHTSLAITTFPTCFRQHLRMRK